MPRCRGWRFISFPHGRALMRYGPHAGSGMAANACGVTMLRMVARLAEMDTILGQGGMFDSLVEAVQAIAGPIEDQRRARDSASQRWTNLFSSIEAAMADLPQYRGWLARIRSTGLLKKYSGDDC